MNRKRSFWYQLLLTGTLVSSFLVAGYPIDSVQAQGRPLGAPRGSNKSGGVRGACSAADRTRVLTALVDESDPALTTQANPSFLFYLPFGRASDPAQQGEANSPMLVEFQLQDVNENSVLKNKKVVFSVPQNPGLVKLTLPKTEASLEPNKEYFWVLRVICDPSDNTSNPTVAGWVKRVAPNSSKNVWFDNLAQLVQSPKTNLERWTALLKQFNLQDLSQTPIVELQPEAENNLGAGQ